MNSRSVNGVTMSSRPNVVRHFVIEDGQVEWKEGADGIMDAIKDAIIFVKKLNTDYLLFLLNDMPVSVRAESHPRDLFLIYKLKRQLLEAERS